MNFCHRIHKDNKMIRRFVILTAAALLSPVFHIFADTVSGSVSCSIAEQTITQASPGSCAVSDESEFPFNFSASANTVAAAPTQTSADVKAVASSLFTGYGPSPFTVSASADVTQTFLVSTAGPIRPGYMAYSAFTPYGGTAEGIEFLGVSFIGDKGSSDMISGFLRVTLGTTFEIDLFADASSLVTGGVVPSPNFSQSQAEASLNFSFWEENLTTAVPDFIDATTAPEPIPAVSGGLGLLLLAAMNYKRGIKHLPRA